jgi:DNA-binding transcriptional MerR regulator
VADQVEDAGDSLDAMSIIQLSRRTGVPTRRIRYYVSQRLLPPPIGRGRAAYYTERHLSRLQQITALREVNLGLEEIRNRLGEPESGPTMTEPPLPEAKSWRRWEVVPGVELHVREDLDAATLSTVRVLVGAVRHVLTGGDRSVGEGTGSEE